MTAIHTPAPWNISPLAKQGLYGNRGELAVIGPDERICTVDLVTPAKRGQEYNASCPIRDANARLIAAAPDMLDLLDWASLLVDEDGPLPIANHARALIARIKGETA